MYVRMPYCPHVKEPVSIVAEFLAWLMRRNEYFKFCHTI